VYVVCVCVCVYVCVCVCVCVCVEIRGGRVVFVMETHESESTHAPHIDTDIDTDTQAPTQTHSHEHTAQAQAQARAHSPTHSLTHSLTHSFTLTLIFTTHSLTYSLSDNRTRLPSRTPGDARAVQWRGHLGQHKAHALRALEQGRTQAQACQVQLGSAHVQIRQGASQACAHGTCATYAHTVHGDVDIIYTRVDYMCYICTHSAWRCDFYVWMLYTRVWLGVLVCACVCVCVCVCVLLCVFCQS